MMWFIREDWAEDEVHSASSQWKPDTSLSFFWNLDIEEKVLDRQLNHFEDQYRKEFRRKFAA